MTSKIPVGTNIDLSGQDMSDLIGLYIHILLECKCVKRIMKDWKSNCMTFLITEDGYTPNYLRNVEKIAENYIAKNF